MEDNVKYLQVKNLSKAYNGKLVLSDVSFSVDKGEFVSVLGPSGCGKSTLLRLLIGTETVDGGGIYKEGEDITALDCGKRKMGMVFQNFALFPTMTVLKNVEYALSIHKETKEIARETALRLIDKMGLSEHAQKRPSKLSGGQQQRVAIARTLAMNPEIMLFDEPMSALDVTTRLMLRDELKKIQQEFGITMIYVTHDQEEAFTMSDRIIVMNDAVIEQYGAPREIIDHPQNAYVENFVVRQLKQKIDALTSVMKG